MNKIRPSSKDHVGNIPVKVMVPDESLAFCFKLVDLKHPKFSPTHCKTGYLEKFIERLQNLNNMTVDHFRTNKSKSLRAHKINFKDTSEPRGFRNLPPTYKGIEAWQFEISKREHGRIHGLLMDNTFFIIWLDPKHKLYGK